MIEPTRQSTHVSSLAARVRDEHRAGSFWRRLKDAERATFEEVGQSRRYSKGETLIRAADTGTWAAILHSGRVRVIDVGGSRVLATRWAGDIVGEQALLDGQPRSATVVAETAVRALVLGGGELDRVLNRHPRVLRVLAAVMSERLREADRMLTGQAADAFIKVIRALLQNADKHGHASESGVRVRIGSQAALGESVGVSRDSVVRALRRLRAENVIATNRGVVTIRDLGGLRARAVR